MKLAPKISVIMPIYNSKSYMKKSVDSVLNQSLKEIELICVNDCSKDNSLKELKRLQKKDSRIKILNNTNNVGPGESRNKGILSSKGEFILFVDSDDWLELDACEKLYQIAVTEKAEVFYIRPKIVHGNKIVLDKRLFKKGDVKNREKVFKKNLRRKVAWAPWSKMIKRDLLIKNKIFFPKIHIAEDMVFSVKVLEFAKNISECGEYLYNYLIREGSLMSYKNSERRIENYLESIKLVENFMKDRNIYKKYEKEFIHFKLYNYLAIYGVLYYSQKDLNSKRYKKIISQDRDFQLNKILTLGILDSVIIGSILIKLKLFNLVFFFREKLRRLFGNFR